MTFDIRNAIGVLRTILEIDSVSGHERECVDWLVRWMGTAGLEAFRDDAGNAIGIRGDPGADADELMLLGHIDTVPGRIPVRLHADRLYGRGAVDAKGPLAAMVVAAATARVPDGLRVVVAGAVEEEALSRGALALVGRFRPDACIIGEPSGWDAVTLGYKGRLLADFHHERSTRHTAGPEGGVAEAAVRWWGELERHVESFNVRREGAFDRLQVALRAIRTASDGFTDAVDATAAFRLPLDVEPGDLAQTVRAAAAIGSVAIRGQERAFASPRTTPLAPPFLQAVRRAGGRPRFKLKTGTSDMNVVGPVWGCPIVAYGPGDSRLDHTPDEHVSLTEYGQAIDVLRQVIEEWPRRWGAQRTAKVEAVSAGAAV